MVFSGVVDSFLVCAFNGCLVCQKDVFTYIKCLHPGVYYISTTLLSSLADVILLPTSCLRALVVKLQKFAKNQFILKFPQSQRPCLTTTPSTFVSYRASPFTMSKELKPTVPKELKQTMSKELKPTLGTGAPRVRKRNVQTKLDPETFRNDLIAILEAEDVRGTTVL